jgi:hypothetical protein
MALEVIPTKTVQLASTIPTSARLAAALKPRATPTVSDLAQQIGSISNHRRYIVRNGPRLPRVKNSSLLVKGSRTLPPSF